MANEKQSVDNNSLFDNPKNVTRLLHFLYGSCALLLVLDFVIHRHVLHRWENLWGFYPLYGFVGCVVLVVVATWMRTFLMRAQDYYDDQEQDSQAQYVEDRDDLTHHAESGDDVANVDTDDQPRGELSQQNKAKIGVHHVDA